MVDIGWDDIVGNIALPGVYTVAKELGGWETKDINNAVSDLGSDFDNVGQNKYQGTAYTPGELSYGGQYGADNLAEYGLSQANRSRWDSDWYRNQARTDRGPRAWENQELSNREAEARYGDQSGAMQLAREAAMGMAPSQAAYQLQAGLDRGLAQQSAMAGGARGSAGLAMASANQAAAGANMQNQAFTEAGRLRAQEMGDARQLYGGLAGQQRDQDMQRLQMGNQMSQFNAGLNDQYRLGMAGAANQAAQGGLGWYQASQNPYNQQLGADVEREKIAADSYNQNENRKAEVMQANAEAKYRRDQDKWSAAGTVFNTVAGAASSGGKK